LTGPAELVELALLLGGPVCRKRTARVQALPEFTQ